MEQTHHTPTVPLQAGEDSGADQRKTKMPRTRGNAILIETYALASQVLRSAHTVQAGFNARLVERFPQKNKSVLFKEGAAHRAQRTAVARFFTPKAVGRYRQLIHAVSERLVAHFRAAGTAALDDLSLELSTTVAAEIVGLTASAVPGLERRLSRIFDIEAPQTESWLATASYVVRSQFRLLMVFLLDVWPAIRSHRRSPREDLLSYLIEQKWSTLDILTECVTYSAAGISTTREFIIVAALHLLEQDDLRNRFLAAGEAERLAIVEEILRLEPPVGTLLRRTSAPLCLAAESGPLEIPAGAVIAIDVRGVNSDPAVAGACPHRLEPQRSAPHLSFGDGHHKCPGAPIALEETAIFLDYLLRVPGVRVERQPDIGWNSMTTGYTLRDVKLTAR